MMNVGALPVESGSTGPPREFGLIETPDSKCQFEPVVSTAAVPIGLKCAEANSNANASTTGIGPVSLFRLELRWWSRSSKD